MEVYKHIEDAILSGQEGLEIEGLSSLIEVLSLGEIKKVNKPWGFEIWLSDGTESPYAFKIIGLKAGTKTSLQYHDKKSEHNFLLGGQARLHYENQETGEIEATAILNPGNLIVVRPPAIHRVEAITDVILIEASTTELDDVIRLSDDYSRPDGKIESEHSK